MMPCSGPTPKNRRNQSWARLAERSQIDVLVIGGGVNGVATLRDLALNGVSAALIDAADFCAGASSASSRMAHGGLRYLEGREFRLVREAARERNMLLHDAPHAVLPLEIVVPVAHRLRGLGASALRFLGLSRRSGPLSLVALKGALTIYERFGAVRRALPRHHVWTAEQVAGLRLAGSVGSVLSYFDGQILHPEALVLDMLDQAVAHDRVAALNYVDWRFGKLGEVRLRDRLSDRELTLSPRVIVNAAGSAIDAVNTALGIDGQLLRNVKGAHLLLRNTDLSQRMAGRAFYFDDGQGRMVICLPVGQCILMGTTEVEAADPADKAVSDQEIDYLLSSLRRLFADIAVDRGQIVAVTSGIRPLQASGGNATQAARDHALVEGRAGNIPVLSLVGGKWTTFRSFAESAADRVLQVLGQTRKASTSGLAYPAAAQDAAGQIARASGLSKERVAVLIARYGAGAGLAADWCKADDAPLPDLPEHYSRGEIRWLVEHRMACSLQDLVLRRTGLVTTGQLQPAGLRRLAEAMAAALAADDGWIETEVALAVSDPRVLFSGTKTGRDSNA